MLFWMERSPERSLNARPNKYGRKTEAVLNLLPITQSNQRLPETLRYNFVFRYSFFFYEVVNWNILWLVPAHTAWSLACGLLIRRRRLRNNIEKNKVQVATHKSQPEYQMPDCQNQTVLNLRILRDIPVLYCCCKSLLVCFFCCFSVKIFEYEIDQIHKKLL